MRTNDPARTMADTVIVAEDAAEGRVLGHEQPVVFQLPHSDRKVLYVNELATSHIVGMDRAVREMRDLVH